MKYSVEAADGKAWATTPQEAAKNPEAKRWYKFQAGDDDFILESDPNDPVKSDIEEIYKSAIKA